MKLKGECTCYTELELKKAPRFIKCSLCKAAPDMYKALKVAKGVLDSNLFQHPDDAILQLQCSIIDKALAKAEEK